MKFLHDRRRAGVLALLGALIGAAALFLGAGGAMAATGPCDDDAPPTDAWVNVAGVIFVGTQPFGGGSPLLTPSYTGAWVCATPPGRAYAIEFLDNDASNPGGVVWVYECNHPTTSCHKAIDWTGADVNPTTSTNAPMSGAAGTGASAGYGSGTCVYANGTASCPFGVTVAGVTVNEADLVPSVTPYTPTPPCTGVNNTCIPVGATVRILSDTANPTASVTTGATGSTTNVDAAPTGTCVQVNATC